MNLLMSFLAACQKDPWGPMSAGALLALLAFLFFKGPLKKHVEKYLAGDLAKRIAVAVMGVVPALVSILNDASKWDKALGTAALSILVSQGLFFLVKPAKPPAKLPADAPKDSEVPQ